MTTKEIQEYLQSPEKPDLRYFPYQVAHDLSDLAAVLLYDIYREHFSFATLGWRGRVIVNHRTNHEC